MGIFLIAFLIFFSQASELVSSGVGKVGEHHVTSREVYISRIIEQSMIKEPAKTINLDYGSESFKRDVSQVILEWMVYFESKAFSVSTISEQDKKKALERFENYLKTNPQVQSVWSKLEVSSKGLNDFMTRKLTAEDFLNFKAKSSVVNISDGEVEMYYQRNSKQFQNMPLDKVRENIRGYISQQQADRRIKEWFRVLQKKYAVKHNLIEVSTQ